MQSRQTKIYKHLLLNIKNIDVSFIYDWNPDIEVVQLNFSNWARQFHATNAPFNEWVSMIQSSSNTI